MKKISFIILLSILYLSSCTNQPKSETKVPTYCDKDTLEVVELTTQYLNLIKEKKFDQAMQMLRHIEGDNVSELTENEKKELEKQYKLFPVLSYKIENYTFTDIYHNEITYSIEFFKKANDDKTPNTMRFTLQPKRINAVWYLTVLNRSHMSR